MKCTRTNPTPLAAAIRRAHGFTLVETLLTIGVLSALGTAALVAYTVTDAKADVRNETDALEQSAQRIERSIGLLGSYSNVSTALVNRDSLAGDFYKKDGRLVNAWGDAVGFYPATVNVANDAFLVETQVPAKACAGLVSAMATKAWDIRVDGVSVLETEGGALNVGAAGQACENSAGRLGFVFYSGLVAGTAVAAPPLQLPPGHPSVTPPTSPPTGGPVGPADPVGPAGPLGPVTSAPPVTPPPSTPSVPPPSTPVTPTAPPSTTPPSAPPPPTTVTACVAPPSWTQTESRSSPCPAGQIGLVFESRTAQHSYTCPEAWDAPVEAVSPWSAWTVTGTTCAPACSAPAPTSTAITRALADENANVGCPVGQLGDHWQRRSVTENGTRTTSWTCPGPTSSTSDTWGGGFTYGAWVTTSNTCAGACVLPTPSTQTNTENRTAQQSLACPAGQTGEIKQERQEQRTQTRTAYCPAPTGAFAWSGWSAWSGWTATSAWTTTSNNCSTPTPATCAASYAAVLAAGNVWTRTLSTWETPMRGDFSGGFAPGHPTEANGQCAATSVNGYVAIWGKGDTTITWTFYGSIGP